MADISLLDAWQLWLDGKSTLRQTLFGVPMIWWGRLGKMVAFAGGLTVVLDIIGPDRLRRVGRRVGDELDGVRPQGCLSWVRLLVYIALAGAASYVVAAESDYPLAGKIVLFVGEAVLLMAVVMAAGEALVYGLSWALDRPIPGNIFRALALFGIVVGFHFDLLAS